MSLCTECCIALMLTLGVNGPLGTFIMDAQIHALRSALRTTSRLCSDNVNYVQTLLRTLSEHLVGPNKVFRNAVSNASTSCVNGS